MVNLKRLLPWAKKDQGPMSLRELLKDMDTGKAGVTVNWQTALQAVTALSCARVIGEGLAQVPLKLHKDRPNGGSDPQKQDALYKLVNAMPNPYLTSYEWRETMALHLVFAGNAYALLVRMPLTKKIVELLPLNPKYVTPKKQEGTGTPYYEVRVGGKAEPMVVTEEDMLHVRGIAWDNSVGLDGVQLAREAIGLALATEEHGERLFANGAQPNGILTTDGNLADAEVRKKLRESWDETHKGLSNAMKIAILWGGLKYMPTAQSNVDSQFLETRAFQIGEVCRWARVLPHMVGHTDKAMTFASAEQMFLAHVIHTLGPWYVRIEQALDRKLLTQAQRDQGYYFRHNVSALLRGSHADRASYFSKALGAGGSPAWMTQDEVRGLDELNPLGGDADKLPVATNVPPPNNSQGAQP